MLQMLIELKKVGLLACMVIKKCRYWPAMVPGDEFSSTFNKAPVGVLLVILGVLMLNSD